MRKANERMKGKRRKARRIWFRDRLNDERSLRSAAERERLTQIIAQPS